MTSPVSSRGTTVLGKLIAGTFSILEAERLIRLGEEATGKDRKEAVMILNHKEAIQCVVDHLTGSNSETQCRCASRPPTVQHPTFHELHDNCSVVAPEYFICAGGRHTEYPADARARVQIGK
jgi:hypothetical protein